MGNCLSAIASVAKSRHFIEERNAGKKSTKEVRNYTNFLRAFEILNVTVRLGHVTTFSIQIIHFEITVLDWVEACL